MSEAKDITVIYHKQCVDGFASAFVCWLAFGNNAEYIPMAYGDDPPDVRGKNLYIVDFSFKRDVMLRLMKDARRTRVFDHHKTAQAELFHLEPEIEGLESNARVIFDMERSGAGITWDELFFDSPRHWLVNYVEDRDLWRWKLENSREVNAYISALPFVFDAWQYAMDNVSSVEAKINGMAIQLKQKQYCIEVARNARPIRLDFNGKFCDTYIVNAPQHDISELLEYLMDFHNKNIVMGYFQRDDGMFQYSLRSRGDNDVSEFAKAFGGGGHKNAAGFQHKDLIL